MTLITDTLAAHTLALRIDADRKVLDCGHVSMPDYVLVTDWQSYADSPGQGATGWAGYATDPATGATMCPAHAHLAELESLRTADRFAAYLSADARSIVSWPGRKLGTVTSYGESRAAHKTYVRVTDLHGAHWHGVGPLESGTYVSLRRTRSHA